MTRCAACDANLTNLESSRKTISGGYLDLCDKCYNTIADDLTNVKEQDMLLPIIEDEESFHDFDDLYDVQTYEQDSRS
jgi:hypothetical protein